MKWIKNLYKVIHLWWEEEKMNRLITRQLRERDITAETYFWATYTEQKEQDK